MVALRTVSSDDHSFELTVQRPDRRITHLSSSPLGPLWSEHHVKPHH